jgi:hypothetical protein
VKTSIMTRLLLSLFSISAIGCTTSLTKPQAGKPFSEFDYKDDHNQSIGCSWYCGAPPISVTASSTLSDGIYSYAAANAHDQNKSTVWVEGVADNGIGERLTFIFDMRGQDKNPAGYEFGIDQVSIINGFARSEKLWRANARVKDLKVIYNGKYLSTVHLADTIKPQQIALPKMVMRPGRQEKVTFEIADVYPGDEHEDTVLADFSFGGFGVH